ncbi:hypothetical protein Ga0080574_TMP1141 [Salipiger abyssi]|uniref:Uncharacterized protein n=1 Tax=Salipiger abyssi TaxID=1250539 RepID=A0A1P8UQ01_9RHOB|nr:hypothetical protein Ga0080574_TMP1141 [Salipiger abyssi]
MKRIRTLVHGILRFEREGNRGAGRSGSETRGSVRERSRKI